MATVDDGSSLYVLDPSMSIFSNLLTSASTPRFTFVNDSRVIVRNERTEEGTMGRPSGEGPGSTGGGNCV